MLMVNFKEFFYNKDKNTHAISVTYTSNLEFIYVMYKFKQMFSIKEFYIIFPEMNTSRKGHNTHLMSLNEFCNLLPNIENLDKCIIILIDLYLYDLKQELERRRIKLTGGKANKRHIVEVNVSELYRIWYLINYNTGMYNRDIINHDKLQLTKPKKREKDWISTKLIMKTIDEALVRVDRSDGMNFSKYIDIYNKGINKK